MALTTVTVSIDIEQCVGTPLPNARVSFELTGIDIDGALVVPQATSVTCNASGVGSIALWPNARGSQGTQYKVTVFDQNGGHQSSALATVPATNCNLHAILTTPAPATVSDAQAAANAAQAAQAATEIAQAAVEAASSSASTDAGTATTQAGIATTKAAEAADSAAAALAIYGDTAAMNVAVTQSQSAFNRIYLGGF